MTVPRPAAAPAGLASSPETAVGESGGSVFQSGALVLADVEAGDGLTLTLTTDSAVATDAAEVSGASVATAGRFIAAADGAVTPGSWTLAAAGAVPAPASIRTTPTTVIGMASLPNLMASP